VFGADAGCELTETRESKNSMKKPDNAYVLRQSPSNKNLLEEISLPKNLIVNGWSAAKGLMGEKDYWRFRETIKRACYRKERGYRKAGYGAATMWRFIYDMKPGDWVVVPHGGSTFYVAELTGKPYYDDSKTAHKTNSSYRRPVRWLNDKKPIERRLARSRLTSRMKTQQTSADASDLIEEIAQSLQLASHKRPLGASTLFADSLRAQLVEAACREIQEGHMDERKFELLVRRLLLAIGATTSRLVPRLKDKGVDIVTEFPLGPVGRVGVGVQVKYHRNQTGKEWVDQLRSGLKEEGLAVGWLVSSADFAPDVQEYLEKQVAGSDLEINLVDGQQLAEIIVDCGLERLLKEESESLKGT
jgi:predicted Mrr-cat superfamily restriction endonuclease